MQPIAAEKNNQSEAQYYAVAVVRENSEVTDLKQLKNLRSCHTGFGRTSGWIVPVGALVEANLIPTEECNRALEVANFFSGSCVPGAADARINTNGSGVETLCAQCVGDNNGQHVCERSLAERYNGYKGALRCLVENKGDVAFVNHLAPLQLTDGTANELWARNLRSIDLRLLCRQGGQRLIEDYKDCNLAKVPAHFVAMSQSSSHESRLDAVQVLTSVSNILKTSAENSFKLFGTFQNMSDLIFGDSTTEIVAIPSDVSYRQALGDFLPLLEDNDQRLCENAAGSLKISTVAYLSMLILLRLI